MSGICTAVLSVSYYIFDHRTGPILVQKDTGHLGKYHVGGISRVMLRYVLGTNHLLGVKVKKARTGHRYNSMIPVPGKAFALPSGIAH
jgi:hypothetical protein